MRLSIDNIPTEKTRLEEKKNPRIEKGEKVLVYGIGNLGRQDDGLGIRLVERLRRTPATSRLKGILTLEANYQLSIEDALLLSEFDVVLFADASRGAQEEPFSVTEVQASTSIAFTTHAMSISNVVSLCDELYRRKPRTYLIALPGYQWGISEQLSREANMNLERAFASFSALLTEVVCTNSL